MFSINLRPFVRSRYRLAMIGMLLIAISLAGIFTAAALSGPGNSVLQVHHCPTVYSRRTDDLTANICGRLSPFSADLRYRLNGGAWIDSKPSPPRLAAPNFVIELSPEELAAGRNHLELSVTRFGIAKASQSVHFHYWPHGEKLPLVQDWSSDQLDVYDGRWEVIEIDGERRVRPTPGTEDYDRIVAVCGALPGGRRVETTVTYRHHLDNSLYGFGVLPLWGGRPNSQQQPRDGWIFSLAWYYSHSRGVGQSFSFASSAASAEFTERFRSMNPQSGQTYHIVAECFPVVGSAGQHLGYRQRMKWWAAGEGAPQRWMQLDDFDVPLPAREYAVALVAHRCQVEFGSVRVSPIAPTPFTAPSADTPPTAMAPVEVSPSAAFISAKSPSDGASSLNDKTIRRQR